MTGQDRLPEQPQGGKGVRERLVRILKAAFTKDERHLGRYGLFDLPSSRPPTPEPSYPTLTPGQRRIADSITQHVADAVSFPEEQRKLELVRIASEEAKRLFELEQERARREEVFRLRKPYESTKRQEEAIRAELIVLASAKKDLLQKFQVRDRLEALRGVWGRGMVREVVWPEFIVERIYIPDGYALICNQRKITEDSRDEIFGEHRPNHNNHSGIRTLSWREEAVGTSISLKVSDKLDVINIDSVWPPNQGKHNLDKEAVENSRASQEELIKSIFPVVYKYWQGIIPDWFYEGRHVKVFSIPVEYPKAGDLITQLLALDWYLRNKQEPPATPEQMFKEHEPEYLRLRRKIGKEQKKKIIDRVWDCYQCYPQRSREEPYDGA